MGMYGYFSGAEGAGKFFPLSTRCFGIFSAPRGGGLVVARFWPHGGVRIARSRTESGLQTPCFEAIKDNIRYPSSLKSVKIKLDIRPAPEPE